MYDPRNPKGYCYRPVILNLYGGRKNITETGRGCETFVHIYFVFKCVYEKKKIIIIFEYRNCAFSQQHQIINHKRKRCSSKQTTEANLRIANITPELLCRNIQAAPAQHINNFQSVYCDFI